MKRYRDNNINKTRKGWQWLLLVAVMLMGAQVVEAQVKVPFKKRSSDFLAGSPDSIYHIKGDFQMIGNTNLTLTNYSETGNNNASMTYVDVDNDPQTLNSSSATLLFPKENDEMIPECSNIIYAGLYWSGRAHDGTSNHTFTVTKNNIPGAGAPQTVNNNQTVASGNSITYTDYSLTITSSGNNNNRTLTYTFTPSGNGNKVAFIYAHNNGNQTLQVRVNDGAITTIPTSSIDADNATLQTPYIIYSQTGGISLALNRLQRNGRNSGTTGNSVRAYTNVAGTYRANGTVTKTFDKSKVLLKHASRNSYFPVEASVTKSGNNWSNNIYFPRSSDGYMYSAYADVTEYVQENGVGEYFVADIATTDGTGGGGTGFYGGWGMIVVYENSKMKWRDIAIFDGHAYINDEIGGYDTEANTTYYELPISGFNTAQHGDIRIKYGLIAGEGDKQLGSISHPIFGTGKHIDRFSIINNNNQWVNLYHQHNDADNYFNSSIYTGGNPRNPNLVNNTGIDIVMDLIPNANKSVIGNSQTSTKFRYGTNQDTYIIFNIAFAVDAYIPDVEPYNKVEQVTRDGADINMSTFDNVVLPGDIVEFKMEIKNKGTEAVKDLKIDIPIPFSGSFYEASATYNSNYYGTAQNSKQPVHDGGAPGKIIWDIGDLPEPPAGSSDDVLATITYKIIITTDCTILTNAACNSFTLDGSTSGEGVTSKTKFNLNRFVTGFHDESTLCGGEPIYAPINLEIDADAFSLANCEQDPDFYKRHFEFCDIEDIPMTGVDGIRPQFPVGTRFYSGVEFYYLDEDGNEVEDGDADYPFVRKESEATEYGGSGISFPLMIDEGPQTYYAIAPGLYVTCYWEFTIDVVQYCGNFWYGISTDWSDSNNWTAKEVPAEGEDVEFATVVNNKNKPAINNLLLDQDRVIGNLINGSTKNLIIPTGKQLTIEGTVEDTNASGGTIIVESAKDQPTGTLLFTDKASENINKVDATVQFYNKAYTCEDCRDIPRQEWQYFGIPVTSASPPTGLNINKWNEAAFGDKWVTPGSILSAFGGYEANDNSTTLPSTIYDFKGKLNIGDAEIPLSYTESVNYKGWNLIGNSYTAAIPISTDAITYSGNWNSTVYLFNTGSRHSWRKLSGNTAWGLESGRYKSVPLHVAGSGGLPSIIPSMHAFMIKATSAGKMTLDYSKLTKNTLVDGVAWRSSSQPAKLPYIVMDVIGSQSADRVWLFEKMTSTRGFDAGWDGEKMAESGLMQLYVAGNDDLKLQVATVPQLHDTYLGLKPDNNENISISFSVSGDVEPRGLHLRDMLTGRTFPIRNNAEYTLPGAMGENNNRFKVVAIAQGDEGKYLMADDSLIEIFVLDNRIGVSNKTDESGVATVYDVTGKVVTKQSVEQNATAYINSGRLPRGVYVVKVKSGSADVSKRIMIK